MRKNLKNLSLEQPQSKKTSLAMIMFGLFFIVFLAGIVNAFTATGGTETTDGNYTIHTFTSNGTFNVMGSDGTVEILVVAGGGGGGGYTSDNAGGGGGAGGIIHNASFTLVAGNYNVIVGLGGSSSIGGTGTTGQNSSFSNAKFSMIAFGGGLGSRGDGAADAGGNGGSGGGGSAISGGAGTTIQDNVNGTGYGNNGGANDGTNAVGAGGGGANAAGSGNSGVNGGNGGNGRTFNITNGTNLYYAGGGGGGASSGTQGTGGLGGGATADSSWGGNATNGTGGGGGAGKDGPGGGDDGRGGLGGSGIVIVRYSTEQEISVTLLTPSNNTQINDDTFTFIARVTPGGFNLTNATIHVWFNNGTRFGATQTNTSIAGNLSVATNVTFNVSNLLLGNYFWNVFGRQGNSNGTNSSFATNNFTFEFIPFEVSGENFVNQTYETKNETFYINIMTDSTVSNIGAFLNYNGSRYAATKSCSGGFCQINTRIDIPLVTNQLSRYENKTWFWQVTLFGASFGTFSTNTTSHQQNVTNIAIRNSNSPPTGINFTIHNETNLSFSQSSDFKVSFSYYLGEGTVKEKYNFSGVGSNFYSFNISDNITFITTSEIEIKNGTAIERDLFFNKELYTNSTTTKKLFIPDNDFSDIIVEVKDQGLVPLENILVNISRFYPDINTYEQVDSQTTDEFGQFSAKLVERDAKYKFAFYDLNNVLLKTSDRISIDCRATICIVPFVIETTDRYFDRFGNTTLFDYSFSFSNTTNIFTYSWDDQTGQSATHRLEVTRYTLNSSTIVCNSTSTSTVSSLSCSVGSGRATYKAQVFRLVSGQNERRVALLDVVVGSAVSTYGVEGLMWVFILLFTCVGIGAFNPVVGITLYGVGFIFMGVLGIISMPISVFFANTILCVIFIWAVRT